ncbi:hypothetical protein QUF07_02380 [Lentilactobacillus sp. TOM.63]|uniref:hypothetical protein n=1 Tax=Lentilactobacillus sp. TOM.63 TaxID=3055077 RepID=UPI0025A1A37D|nr:hypothetical protein [Lentilactobacillus sp. TOM.63]MDM7515552.1 hypothetical protein [Lentilactobacillus sp. TOM.63]
MSTINGKACVANGRNLIAGIEGINKTIHQAPGSFQWIGNVPTKFIKAGEPLCFSIFINNAPHTESLAQGSAWCVMQAADVSGNKLLGKGGNSVSFDADGISQASLAVPTATDSIGLFIETDKMSQNAYYGNPKVEFGTIATPLTPAPVDKVFSDGKQVYGRNILAGIDRTIRQAPGSFQWVTNVSTKFIKVGEPLCFSAFINNAPHAGALVQGTAHCIIQAKDVSGKILLQNNGNAISFDADGISQANLVVPTATDSILLFVETDGMSQNTYYGYPKVEFGNTATPWTPAPEDVLK